VKTNSGSSTVPVTRGVLNLPVVVVSARNEVHQPAPFATHRQRAMSGRLSGTAGPSSNPPLEPPMIANRSRLVIPLL